MTEKYPDVIQARHSKPDCGIDLTTGLWGGGQRFACRGEAALAALLRESFGAFAVQDVQSCIIDSELVAFDQINKKILPFQAALLLLLLVSSCFSYLTALPEKSSQLRTVVVWSCGPCLV